MSRRGNNIRKRKDGRWEGRYIYDRDINGKAIYKSIYARTYTDVKRKLQIALQNQTTEQKIHDKHTIDEAAKVWLENTKKYRKYSTYVKYSYIYYSHIKEFWGDKVVTQIAPCDYKAYLDYEEKKTTSQNKHLSKSTIKSILTVLKQITHSSDKIVSATYIDKKFSNYINENSITILTQLEQIKLQNYLLENMNNYNLGIYICLFTGLRLGEICALKAENIDLLNQTISVEQTVQRIKTENDTCKTKLILTNPKTFYSKRKIPICDVLLNVLQKNITEQQYVVNGNKVMEPRTYQYYFKRILVDLSIPPKNFHILRHSFATCCINSGMDPKCLSEILGHSNVKITLDRYVHPSLEQKKKQLNLYASQCGQFSGHGYQVSS